MSLLDRYIIRQYLVNLLALVVILCFFILTIDASLNISRYWGLATRLTTVDGEEAPVLLRTAWMILVVLDLWWPRLLNLINLLLGLLLVAGMGFTCAQLSRHRELVVMLTAGQSLFRVARPILVVALTVTAAQALMQEFILPRVAPLLTREPEDVGRRAAVSARVPLTDDGLGRLLYADAFDAEQGVLHEVYIWERDGRGLAVSRTHASRAVWRDGGWDLHDVEVIPLSEGPPSPLAAERLVTDLDPTILKMKRHARFGNYVSYTETARILRRLDEVGGHSDNVRDTREQLTRAALGRISAMMTNLLVLIIAMGFFITREPRSMVVQSLKCAPVAIIAVIGGIVAMSVSLPGIPAAVSVFLPVMVLTPIAIAVVTRVRT